MNAISLKNELTKKLNNLEVSERNELASQIVSFVLSKKKSELVLVDWVSEKQIKTCFKIAKKLNAGIPFQHISKKVEFLNVLIEVNKNVLIPRMETELLADIAIEYVNNNKVNSVLDLCTGSGAIGIAIAKNTNSKVTISDISKKALNVAKINANNTNVRVNVVRSNMFKGLQEKFDVIISNPPYIPKKDIKNLSNNVKKHEPKLALSGREDGLHFYKIIANEAPKFLNSQGKIFLEIGIGQENDIIKLLEKSFEDIKVIKDYNKINRIIIAKLKV